MRLDQRGGGLLGRPGGGRVCVEHTLRKGAVEEQGEGPGERGRVTRTSALCSTLRACTGLSGADSAAALMKAQPWKSSC